MEWKLRDRIILRNNASPLIKCFDEIRTWVFFQLVKRSTSYSYGLLVLVADMGWPNLFQFVTLSHRVKIFAYLTKQCMGIVTRIC